MAVEMSFDAVKRDLDRKVEDKALIWTCKDKKTKVTLRPLMYLADKELNTVTVLIKGMSDDDDEDFDKRMKSIDTILGCAADKKEAFKRDMAEFPASIRAEIFNAWMGSDDEQGEASDSES